MSITRIVKGTYTKITHGPHNMYAGGDIITVAGNKITQTAEKGITYSGNPDPLPSSGMLDLVSIAINTTYDVCNDEVENFNDYKNFWILENKGKYYHWLNQRTNADDKNKPNPLPFTLASTDNFILKATFKTKNPVEYDIRIKDSDGKYIFNTEHHPKKRKDGEHEIVFKCTTKPYKNTVQYLENFTLNFEYSEDGNTWLPMKSVKFCFYLTWKEPLFSIFDTTSTETMQIKCKANKNKENICETLLWIGCKKGGGKSINSEEILIDNIFDEFKSLKITRRRETKWQNEGLGYWRNVSMGDFTRGLRTLLKDGEARCGEWTTFFQHILLSQGLSVGNDTIGICTEIATSYGFIINPEIPDSYSQVSKVFKPVPTSYQFAVKNAIHIDITNPSITLGNSPGQGNPTSQPLFIDHFWFYYTKGKRFYDASYGKSYNQKDSNLNKYCQDNLNSVFLLDVTKTKGSIETINLHNYIRSTKNLF